MASPAAGASSSYRAIWRWHFIAGLFVAPVLVLMAITGSLYLFDREIEGVWNRSIQTIVPGGHMRSLADQEAAVRRAWPDASLRRVRLPTRPDETAIWSVETRLGVARDVYVDPYRAVVTGDTDPDTQPMAIVRRIHGTLLAGDIGSYVVELVACWTLVMLVTGVMLWWPRRWQARGVIVPRLATRGRCFWRDLHAIPSLFNLPFIALLILTGLPWSAFWGVQFASLGAYVPFIAPTPNFGAAPPDVAPAGETAPTPGPADPHARHRAAMAQTLPWVVQNSPAPHGMARLAMATPAAQGIAAVEPWLARLDRAHFGPGVRIFYPDQPGDAFTINYVPDKAEGQRTIRVRGNDGALLSDVGWENYSPVGRWVEWGTMTHMGRQYGLANQLANLAVCLTLIGTITAGIILWWRRRPVGRIGTPDAAGTRLPRGLTLALIAMGIIFPLVGATMLLVLAMGALRSGLATRRR